MCVEFSRAAGSRNPAHLGWRRTEFILPGLCWLSYIRDLCGKEVGFLVDRAEQGAAFSGAAIIMLPPPKKKVKCWWFGHGRGFHCAGTVPPAGASCPGHISVVLSSASLHRHNPILWKGESFCLPEKCSLATQSATGWFQALLHQNPGEHGEGALENMENELWRMWKEERSSGEHGKGGLGNV